MISLKTISKIDGYYSDVKKTKDSIPYSRLHAKISAIASYLIWGTSFSEYFGFDVLGVNRFFTAQQANQQIELVVNVPGWPGARVTDYAELDDGIEDHVGVKFRIRMVQQQKDDNGLNMTKLSLERIKG